MRAYDSFCRVELPGKIPKWQSREHRKRVGDCIYDFSGPGRPNIRPGVHGNRNGRVDLGGRNAVLSEHFFYFGDHPRDLPEKLGPIVHQTQGHKSLANTRYAEDFVEWIESLRLRPNRLYGEPQMKAQMVGDKACTLTCSARDLREDESDRVRECE